MLNRVWLVVWVAPALACGDVVGEPIRIDDAPAVDGGAEPEGQDRCEEECRPSEQCVDGVCVEQDWSDDADVRCESGCVRDGQCFPADRCSPSTGDRH